MVNSTALNESHSPLELAAAGAPFAEQGNEKMPVVH